MTNVYLKNTNVMENVQYQTQSVERIFVFHLSKWENIEPAEMSVFPWMKRVMSVMADVYIVVHHVMEYVPCLG